MYMGHTVLPSIYAASKLSCLGICMNAHALIHRVSWRAVNGRSRVAMLAQSII